MPSDNRGSEEPGDQILDRQPDPTNPDADPSSKDRGRSLDREAKIAGGRWEKAPPEDPGVTDQEQESPDDLSP